MAKPIRKTPTLKEKESNRFISNMLKTEKRKINSIEKELVRLVCKTS